MGDPEMTGYEPMLICCKCKTAVYRHLGDAEGDPCLVCGWYLLEVDFEDTNAE